MVKLLIPIAAILIVLGFLVWKFGPNFTAGNLTPKGPVTLNYWGLSDEQKVRPQIEEFQKFHPNIKVVYSKQNLTNYRTRVQTQIREGKGPDVFTLHNSWLPLMSSDLYPAPPEAVSLNDFKKNYYPVAEASFVKEGKIYALPTSTDGLALYYNEEIIQAVGVSVPKSWQEFTESANRITVKDSNGQIKTSGAAMGTTNNVDYWPDILGLLLLQQPGVDLNNLSSTQTAEVLKFYTSFNNDPAKKTWDSSLSNSSALFAEGKLAFYFGPSSKAPYFRTVNPNLIFKTAPVPQLPGGKVAWGSFWGEGVSVMSQNPKEAWEFTNYLASKEGQKLAYSTEIQTKLSGTPYGRADLAQDIINDPVAGAYIQQGPIYKTWYLNSETQDFGINEEMIEVFKGVVDSVSGGGDPQGAVQSLGPKVKEVLDKYTKIAPVAPAGQTPQ